MVIISDDFVLRKANVMLANAGGLTGSYFENVWFFYTPVKVTVDPQINMDWGIGLITPTGANYISARWVGKVKTLVYTIIDSFAAIYKSQFFSFPFTVCGDIHFLCNHG